MDLGETYARARSEFTDFTAALDPDLPVPATPQWTVGDVLAHVVGVAVDLTGGNVAGAPGDDWTAAQVARGRELGRQELVETWEGVSPDVEQMLRDNPATSNAVFDLLTHYDDVREAAGATDDGAPAHKLLLSGFGRFVCGGRVRSAALPALRLVATDTGDEVVAGDGDPVVTLSAPRYELVRTLAGRRSREHALGLEWSGAAEDYVDLLPLFSWGH